MPAIYSVRRTSGVNLAEVRRPGRGIVGITAPVPEKGDVKTEKPAPEPKAKPLPKSDADKPAKNSGKVSVKRG